MKVEIPKRKWSGRIERDIQEKKLQMWDQSDRKLGEILTELRLIRSQIEYIKQIIQVESDEKLKKEMEMSGLPSVRKDKQIHS